MIHQLVNLKANKYYVMTLYKNLLTVGSYPFNKYNNFQKLILHL